MKNSQLIKLMINYKYQKYNYRRCHVPVLLCGPSVVIKVVLVVHCLLILHTLPESGWIRI